jgi:D-alanyl-lipoteichoic acid acyltransferase DltB (MBOAT superfamily)
VAGPIERSGNLLPQFKKEHPFDLENIKAGLTPFLWGFFKKLVLADQLAVFVNRVYDAPQICGAQELVVATVAFAFQIYCDFSAYSDIACGSAKMLGFSLMQNFNRPYFAVSIKDFWHRWHISLSTWFKEYLYIPLGGSRRVRWRTNCNVLIVFALSGLWHGAALNYVVWGCLNGLYQVIGNFLQPLKKRFYAGLHLSATNRLWLLLRRLCTFTLICIAWIFFRANSVGEAVYILRTILFSFFEKDYFRTALSSLDRAGWLSLIQLCFCLILLLLVDYKSQKQSVRKRFEDSLLLRYSAYFVLIAMTLIFGAYGSGFDPLDFVYFQF